VNIVVVDEIKRFKNVNVTRKTDPLVWQKFFVARTKKHFYALNFERVDQCKSKRLLKVGVHDKNNSQNGAVH
jgi:hypothetical protein